jgi:hypothetical protein
MLLIWIIIDQLEMHIFENKIHTIPNFGNFEKIRPIKVDKKNVFIKKMYC